MASIALITGVSVLLTSFVSAALGMGGGMIMMGIYAWIFPVAGAMVVHGMTQLCANSFRGFLLWRHIYWRGIGWYTLGMSVSTAILLAAQIVLAKYQLFLLLGAIPFLNLIPKLPRFDFARNKDALACGFVVTFAQLTAGISGPLLDIFFIRGSLDRFSVVATKSVTQSAGHLVKIAYYGPLFMAMEESAALNLNLVLIILTTSILGTWLGRHVLERLPEQHFRGLCTSTLLVVGSVYLYRGLQIMA
ncbi:TSUP family transporter [Acanthopleuribacter pedis]|uniref:Probable membrane transporter protein n=1 Tax=Acanthopleuribacter pedis TaxID=442870 RepID=A0A8J7Q7G5_9BACT|nr:TSUP family transporter [Acanthopleuribacter pedis]MBO1319167.1 TSUP family transporter [Acanthopleuribacter pedis]